MKPKWLKEKSIKEIANKKEKDYAKEIGGKVVGGSGCAWSSKGDVRKELCLIEMKTTDKKSIKVDEKFLAKIFKEAVKVGKLPFLVLEYAEYRMIGRVEKR